MEGGDFGRFEVHVFSSARAPTLSPTVAALPAPTPRPTVSGGDPTLRPTPRPTMRQVPPDALPAPTYRPTSAATDAPTHQTTPPVSQPTAVPSYAPTVKMTYAPSAVPDPLVDMQLVSPPEMNSVMLLHWHYDHGPPGTRFWAEYRVNGEGAWHGPEYGFDIPRHHDVRRSSCGMLRAADPQPDGAPDGADGLAHAETDTRSYGRSDARARGRADGGADAGAHARTDDEPDAGTDADAHAAAHGPPDGQAHDRAYVDADGRPDGRGRALALRARRRVQDECRQRVPHLRRDARRRRRRRMPHAVGRRPLLFIVRDGGPQNRRDDLGANYVRGLDPPRLRPAAPRHRRLGRLLPLPAPRRLPLHRQHGPRRQGGFDALGRGPARGR